MMSSNRYIKILHNQYAKSIEELKQNKDSNNIIPIPYFSETNVQKWYYLITGLPGVYQNGEYIFELTAPKSYPQSPPAINFLTPNGVYGINQSICISIGIYHANDHSKRTDGSTGWRPALGMAGFAKEVMNGLISFDSNDHGMGILNNTTNAEKIQYANKSVEYNNKHYAEIYMHLKNLENEIKEEAVSNITAADISANTAAIAATADTAAIADTAATADIDNADTADIDNAATADIDNADTDATVATADMANIDNADIDAPEVYKLPISEIEKIDKFKMACIEDDNLIEDDNSIDNNNSIDNDSQDISSDDMDLLDVLADDSEETAIIGNYKK